MPMQIASYGDVRDRALPGDVIAFLGDNPLSAIIKRSGRAGVSHVGIITAQGSAAQEPQFAESSVHVDDNKLMYGVDVASFRLGVDRYDGAVWWLPMNPAMRPGFHDEGFADFIQHARGQLFDLPGGIEVVLRGFERDILGGALGPQLRLEVEKGYCCSALVATALKKARVVGVAHPEDSSPSDVCSWSIYGPDYVLIKGHGEIRGYNSIPPA